MDNITNIKQLKTFSKKTERENKKNGNIMTASNTLDSTKFGEKQNSQMMSMQSNSGIPDENSMKQMGNDQASKVFAQFG